jgi:hypothetical protein
MENPLSAGKPSSVAMAVKLNYLTLVIGVARSLLEWSRLKHLADLGAVLFITFFVLGCMVWLIYKTDRRRNWARITLLVLFVLGVPFSILPLLQSLANSPLSGVLGLAQVAIQVAALAMLFGRDASHWYRPATESAQPPTPT